MRFSIEVMAWCQEILAFASMTGLGCCQYGGLGIAQYDLFGAVFMTRRESR